MEPDKVCGVLVTYHPSLEVIDNIHGICDQIDALVVVDNGSTNEELESLREASRARGFCLIENHENLGIAEALNQGGRWARSHSYPWVLFFDQDSRVTDGFVDSLLKTWRRHPHRDRVITVQPRHVDPSQATPQPLIRRGDNVLLCSMTSGSLMPVWAFDVVGWFDSEFFIDYVDIEYSLRARERGYLIVESQETVLYHVVGDPVPQSRFGIFSFRPCNHNATRHYYMMRNRIVTMRRYLFKFPRWGMVDLLASSREIAKMLLGEENRRRKLDAMRRGAIDGIAGRMGKMPKS